MEIALFVLCGLMVLTGLIGCVFPVLPGVPLSLAGVLLLLLSDKVDFTSSQIAVYIGLTVLAQITDYLLPVWLTQKFGGSKWSMLGSTIGLIVGLFFGPLGIIAGPILGAILAELISGKNSATAVKSGFGSFVGFLLNTGLKIIVCGYFIWVYISNVFSIQ